MNYFLDLIYQLLVHPREALRTVTRGERLSQSGAVWVFVIFITSLSSIVEGPGFVTVFGLCLLGFAIVLILHSALIDYTSSMIGGRGTAKGITAGFMMASFPYAFSVFGTLLSSAGADGIAGFLGFLIAVWSFVLDVLAISENYGFSTGKSVLVALIPLFIILLFFLCLMLLGVAAAIDGLTQMDGAGIMNEMMQEI